MGSVPLDLLVSIYEAAKLAGWTRDQVAEFVKETFNVRPEDMNERQALAILDHFHRRRRQRQPQLEFSDMISRTCPACKHDADSETCISKDGHAAPVAGDYTICFYCYAVLNFVSSPVHEDGLRLVECAADSIPPEVLMYRDRLRRLRAKLN